MQIIDIPEPAFMQVKRQQAGSPTRVDMNYRTQFTQLELSTPNFSASPEDINPHPRG